MKKYNFYAGPAILPQEVMAEASDAVKSYGDLGLSILEISHRSPEFVSVLEEAESLVREIFNVNDNYAVLFMTGGASSQFFMSAMNLLNKKAAYLDTGAWSTKSIKEAKMFGEVDIVASSKDRNYCYIPKDIQISNDCEYLHLTSNNTIFGTQIHEFPKVDIPILCDASSDIFSRPMELEKFGLIYAGAQKNAGPAGTTLVIIRKDMLGKVQRTIPTMLNYQTHINKGSMFNTPPVFPIYVSMLVLKWIKNLGGIKAMQSRNVEKAKALYKAIDESQHFYGTADTADRSLMNVCFNIKNQDQQDDFIKLTEANGCIGIKGHRSVGGFRASIYNAMDIEGINQLTSCIKEFDSHHAHE